MPNNRIKVKQTVEVTDTIKRLIRSYPGGLGIVKELVQNADDANARSVCITLDWRTHRVKKIPEQGMINFLGPALLVFNDSIFQEKDFEGIQRIGRGTKKQALTKAGRFGLGFNSVYHVTDYPSIASYDRLYIFDPNYSVFDDDGGCGWDLDDHEINDFLTLYNAGLPPKLYLENSTVFRLPFRTKSQESVSKISTTLFDVQEINKLRQELFKISEEMLLFLKSVDEIRVCEILEDGEDVHELLKVTTKNRNIVYEQRQKLISALENNSSDPWPQWNDNNALPPVLYSHEIETSYENKLFTSRWQICSVIRLDEEGEVLSGIKKMSECGEKAVPWAGVAAKIKSTNFNAEGLEGKAFCFLPLNFPTGLPVHIHGFFDLDEARTDLTRVIDSSDDHRKIRADWNLLLVEHVLSYAYAQLISDLAWNIGENSPEFIYKLFPINSGNTSLLYLSTYTLNLLRDKRVIRSSIEYLVSIKVNGKLEDKKTHWVSPENIKILSTQWNHLAEILKLDGIGLPEPCLPPVLQSAFKQANCPLPEFKASDLREHLLTEEVINLPIENVRRSCLTKKEWIINLLNYCLSDGYKNLNGLPLLILSDGTLQSFGYTSSDFVYILENELREIFSLYPQWFLDEELIDKVPKLKLCEGIKEISLVEVLDRLQEIIDPDKESFVKWEPDGENLPNSVWLAQIYSYLANLDLININDDLQDKLGSIPLIPCNKDFLHSQHSESKPLLLLDSHITSEFIAALEYFQLPYIKFNKQLLKKAITEYKHKNPDTLIQDLSYKNLIIHIYVLKNKQKIPPYNNSSYAEILNFLSHQIEEVNHYTVRILSILPKLPIFPTINNTLTNLNNVYIPKSEPPKVAGSFKILQLGENDRWKKLFNVLAVPELNDNEIIKNLVDSYQELTTNQQREALTWIRVHLVNTEDEIEEKNENSSLDLDIIRLIKESELIMSEDGNLRSPENLYHPDNKDTICKILGNKINTPDMEFYKKSSKSWLKFFEKLNLLTSPSADDLLAHVDNLIEQSKQELTTEIESSLMKFYRYIEKDWEILKELTISESNQKFFDSLKERAWLPAERNKKDLEKIPGSIYCLPQAKLYKGNELEFFENSFLVASQRPLFRAKFPLKQFAEALGFHTVPSGRTVVDHFKFLISFWDEANISEIDDKSFQKSINNIYTYFANHFNHKEDSKKWLYDELRDEKCLWDYAEFWLPKHTFQTDVKCFGRYRTKIFPSAPIRDVYELLGQKKSPELTDYLSFIQEIDVESGGNHLNDEQTKCIYLVLQEIDWYLERSLEDDELDDLLLLTDDDLLLPPEAIFLSDAPLRIEAIGNDRTNVKILHNEVPPRLATKMGCLSLLKDLDQRPVSQVGSEDVDANRLCQQWKNQLCSQEFQAGLERLLFHEHNFEMSNIDLNWLNNTNVIPAEKILTELFYKDKCIASKMTCDQYFNRDERAFFLLADDNSAAMVDCLAQGLNDELARQEYGGFQLNDTAKLILILNTPLLNIDEILTKKSIKPYKKPEIKDSKTQELEEDQIFDDDVNDDDDSENIAESQTIQTMKPKVEESIDKSLSGKKNSNQLEETQIVNNQKKSDVQTPVANSISASPSHNSTQTSFDLNSSSKTIHDSKTMLNSDDITLQKAVKNDLPKTNVVSSLGKSVSENSRKSSGSSGISHRSNSNHQQSPRSSNKTSSQTYRHGVRVGSEIISGRSSHLEEEQIPDNIRKEIESKGMQIVLDYEKLEGRTAKDMNEVCVNHPGYDIESIDQQGNKRYIEVKSLKGNWDNKGVLITRTQFETGEKYQDNFWLYVVERVQDSPKLFLIQDPSQLVGEFYYDGSWQQLAKEEVTFTYR